MDFKSLLTKLDGMEAPVATPAAPQLPKAVQLNEDAQLRVLAGQTSYVAEAKKKAEEKKEEVEEGFDSDAKPGDTFKTSKGTATKTKTGLVHTKDKYDYDPGSDDKDDKKRKEKARKTKESVDPEAFKAKFTKMIEGKKGSKPDFLDVDKDGNKKEPMKKALKDKKVGEGFDPEKMKDGDMAGAGGGDVSSKDKKKKGSVKKESVKTSKKVVAESVEQKLTFKQMVQLVQESGGQQQIDAIDTELFNWAQRVAVSKLGEGMKADLYAGLIYERNGGVFQMYDVLAEDQK